MSEVQKCFVIGTSAGGVDALKKILPAFKKPLPVAVMVVIHLPPQGPNLIPSLFLSSCDFDIKEAESGEPIEAGMIYIAPPDYHLSIEPGMTLSLSSEEPFNFSRPSIDILFESAAYSLQGRAAGILMTGANHDGALGLSKIRAQGGFTIVQDPESADYATMPQSALDQFQPDLILNLDDLSTFISQYKLESTL